jgi:hypothetical protein
MGADWPFLEERCTALHYLHEWIGIDPLQWWYNDWLGGPVRTSKHEHMPARSQKRLHRIEHAHFEPHRSQAHQIEGFV